MSASSGMSLTIVASFLLRNADSLSFSSLVLRLPLISSMCSYMPSTDLNSFMSFMPVFSPMPATPLILSDLSPISAFRSMNSSGVSSYFSITSASVYLSSSVIPFLVIYTAVDCDASWRASLSPVTIMTSNPSFSASFERVPIMSSAS